MSGINTYTKNYNLIKPGQDDFYNIDVQNRNMDNIDTALKNEYEGLRNELKDWSVNQFYNPNILINGDFKIWQRGTEFTVSRQAAFTADRFIIATDINGVKVRKTREGYLSVLITQPNASYTNIDYTLEKHELKKGKSYTFTARLKTSPSGFDFMYFVAHVDKKPFISVLKGFTYDENNKTIVGNVYVPYIEQEFSNYSFGLQVKNTVGNEVIIESFKLEEGIISTPFVQRTYSQELSDCQRYYEKIEFQSIAPVSYDADYFVHYEQFKVKKRISPKVKVYSGATNREGYVPSWNWGRNQDMKCNIDIVNDTGFRIVIGQDNYIQDTRHIDFYWIADAEIYN